MSNNKNEYEIDFRKGVVRIDLKKLMTMITNLRPKSKDTLFSILKREHLGNNIETISKSWSGRKGELMLSTIDDYISEHYEHVNIEEGTKKTSYRPINCGQENENLVVMVEGLRALKPSSESSKKHNLIISHELDWDGDIRITVYFSSTNTESREEATDFIKELEDFHWENSPMRGKVFDMLFNILDRDNQSVDNLTLNESTQKKVDFHIIEYINSLEILKQNNVSINRGIILSGPPGTGKTLIVKDVINRTQLTTIVITTAMLSQHLVSDAYRIARKLAPCIVVLEDLDSAGGISRKLSDHPILGEMLSALNGIESNDGVITLATTNYNENLDEALRDRPGRFDVCIKVGLPDQGSRRILIKSILKNYKIGESLDLEYIVKQTDQWTGAWINELIKTALTHAIICNQSNIIQQSNITEAVKDIRERRNEARTASGQLSDYCLDSKANEEVGVF